MDIIDELRSYRICTDLAAWRPPICDKAADYITDLLVENQSLRNAANGFKARAEAAEARAEKAERALAHMWYAYENKDAEFPHEYEKEAVKEAEQLLGKWEDVMPKLLKEE